MHISSNEVFSKIRKKPFIVQKKWYLIKTDFNQENTTLFFLKTQEPKIKSQKNVIYQLRKFPIFFMKISGIIRWIVGWIDAIDIDVAQPIWNHNIRLKTRPYSATVLFWCGRFCYWTILMWEILLLDFLDVGQSAARHFSSWTNELHSRYFL